MTSVLITAFEPYDEFETNASWLALQELTRELPASPRLTTRLYPVDFIKVRERLTEDLGRGHDLAIHLGQAPGTARIHLEAIGLNMGGHSQQRPDQFQPLVPDGPVAYRSQLPLADWAARLRQAGIPAQVSYHAGTFLCNATLYLAHYLAEQRNLETRFTFIHVPLAPEQVINNRRDLPFLAPAVTAAALRTILEAVVEEGSSNRGSLRRA